MYAGQRQWYLVCYDVRSPKRWRRVYRCMQDFGEPVQLSVFRCRLTKRLFEEMWKRLESVMAEEDGLLIMPVPEYSLEGMVLKSPRTPWPKKPPSFVII